MTATRSKREEPPAVELPRRITEQLAELSRSWPGVLDADTIHQALLVPEADSVGTLLTELLGEEQVGAVADACRLMFDLLTANPERKWIASRTGARLVLRLLALSVGHPSLERAVAGTYRASAHWRLEREKRGRREEQDTARRWRWAEQLVAVTASVAAPVREALAWGAVSGDLLEARPAVQRWAIRNTEEAGEVRRILRIRATDLFAAVDEVLPDLDARRLSGPLAALSRVDSRVGFAAGAMVLVGIVVAAWPAGRSAQVPPELAGPKALICEAVEHHRPACVHAATLVEALAAEDCAGAGAALGRLQESVDLDREMLGALTGGEDKRMNLDAGLTALDEQHAVACPIL